MMDDGISRGDLPGNFAKEALLRQGNGYKSVLSGKSTPRSPRSFRRLHSSRTPRREKIGRISLQWFRSNKLVYWLLLITLWTYLGFYVQSRWAHGDDTNRFLGFGHKRNKLKPPNSLSTLAERRNLLTNDSSVVVKNGTAALEAKDKPIGVVLASKGNSDSNSTPRHVIQKKDKKPPRKPKGKALKKQALKEHIQSTESEEQEPEIPKKNTSYGLLVGPFGATEDRLLKWSPENRSGTCDRKGDFARLVWSRRFLLIFHELSMTGAPLSMMELATELLSCGATVSVVVLSKKGGLMQELSRRRIKVLEDKADFSFKVGIKSDVVIAGSAVCASWIDQYIEHFPAGGSQIAWWIMENREEYFHRAKIVLGRVKMVIFLSDSQSKQWLAWCEREKIKLRLPPSVVPLSVNDELAFVAGIPCSLNTPSFTPERMLEKQKILRYAVRAEMGLSENDMLLMTLSSINPGKGQLLLLESARSVIEKASLQPDMMSKVSGGLGLNRTNSTDPYLSRALLQGHDNDLASGSRHRKILINNSAKDKQALKVLIGSVGSKSNKIPYVRETLLYLSQHPNMSQSVRWTPATTRVSSLYSAADVYIINSQGMGETFGRVIIEAMAFGLPVLGTDAGGTKEIVGNNKTGLLHPVGHLGNEVLTRNIQVLLENPSMRQLMGIEGRKKVEKKYLKRHMYKQFATVLSKCMR